MQKSAKIVPNNVFSLKPKLYIISVEFAGYDIKAISETHLDDSDLGKKLFHEPIRKDRNMFCGCVALYVSTKLNDVDRKDLCNTNWVWSEIHSENKTFIVGIIYRPSRSNTQYFEVFLSCIEKAIDTQLQVFLCFY